MCEPNVRDEMLRFAVLADNVPFPITFKPSLNVTLPVGVPLPGTDTDIVAVNVTDSPITKVAPEEVRAVVVLA